MSQGRRTSVLRSESPFVPSVLPGPESEQWIQNWKDVCARDLIDSRIVAVDAETSVEEACDILLSEDTLCLAVRSSLPSASSDSTVLGLFDFSDVNAFLTLAATRHTVSSDGLRANPRVDQIVSAARAGRVPVHLVSNMSEKNYLETLPDNASLLSLLAVFCRGSHRVLIRAPAPSIDYIGMVSDRALLSWFSSYADKTPTFQNYLANSLYTLSLPSLNLYTSVVATTSKETVLDAMKLMSEEGVSCVAVIDEESGTLLSAVSVTDIGKIVAPSQSNQILSTPLHRFITQIKEPDGSMDGVDKYPVYSVFPTSTLSYTIEKILTTNAHRLFVTDDAPQSPSAALTGNSGNLSGIVSVVDILSLFAVVANIPDVDPTRRQRHRRASSSSSSSRSSRSAHDFARSRSSSRTSMRQSASPRISASVISDNPRNSIPSLDSFQWAERVPRKE